MRSSIYGGEEMAKLSSARVAWVNATDCDRPETVTGNP